MKSWHIVGICGIGMSGLAQFARSVNIRVSGSDRALEKSENQSLKAALQAQDIELYPQDGSRFAAQNPPVDAVIYSTAIEESNPDFAASQGIERIHRATALKMLILERCQAGKLSLAVAGSCGKTSTTAMIAEALTNVNYDAECINGGMIKAFARPPYPGNYHPGDGAIVFEADESDKSLLEFHPDYAVILNIGTDHYSKDELQEMFAQFANQAQKGAVLSAEVYELLRNKLRSDLPVRTFGTALADCTVSAYRSMNGESFAEFGDQTLRKLPAPGMHTALNAAAAAALLGMLGIEREAALTAVLDTHGVARRFDFHGRTATGAAVYDDYAHNPEKIANIIAASQELTNADGKVLVFFQPHGYGPFGFMQAELARQLSTILRKQDKFYLAEPYYAGGSSSFSPHAADVVQEWQKLYPTLPVVLAAERAALRQQLIAEAQSGDLILIMGARDNTLAEFASSLTDR